MALGQIDWRCVRRFPIRLTCPIDLATRLLRLCTAHEMRNGASLSGPKPTSRHRHNASVIHFSHGPPVVFNLQYGGGPYALDLRCIAGP